MTNNDRLLRKYGLHPFPLSSKVFVYTMRCREFSVVNEWNSHKYFMTFMVQTTEFDATKGITAAQIGLGMKGWNKAVPGRRSRIQPTVVFLSESQTDKSTMYPIFRVKQGVFTTNQQLPTPRAFVKWNHYNKRWEECDRTNWDTLDDPIFDTDTGSWCRTAARLLIDEDDDRLIESKKPASARALTEDEVNREITEEMWASVTKSACKNFA